MGWTERKGSKAVSQGPADKTAHIPESMLELWVNVHNYLKERIPRYHEPQEPSLQVYTWTFQTVAHNQSKRANTSSSEICWACPRTTLLHLLASLLSIINANSFRTSWILFPPPWYIKTNHQLQDGRRFVFSTWHCCLWFRLHAPGPGLFLASNGLINPFF